MNYFSGIGGFSKGLEAAGYTFDKVYFSEIDKHAIANFKYNFPYAEHIGTVTNIGEVGIERPHIVTFGSPCQNFSAIGDGKGLQGEKATLSDMQSKPLGVSDLTFLSGRMLKGYSSQDIARIFGSIVKAFADIGGYRLEWQLCNTAWFLPQNRERMYLVGRVADRCTADLFPLPTPGGVHGKVGGDEPAARPSGTITRNYGRQPNIGNYVLCLKSGEAYNGTPTPEQLKHVRMLTEVECERLQGFPDNYTRYGIYDGEKKEIVKIHRYALLGNAVSVPVVREVAARIRQTTTLF